MAPFDPYGQQYDPYGGQMYYDPATGMYAPADPYGQYGMSPGALGSCASFIADHAQMRMGTTGLPCMAECSSR